MAITSSYNYTPEQLFAATNDGLDIIHKYLPQSVACENTNKKFKLRDEEKTASATLFKTEKSWIVKDFGNESFNPITLVMNITGRDFKDVLLLLCEEFGLSKNNTIFKPTVEVSQNTDLPLDHYNITFRKKAINHVVVGRFITDELAKEYFFYEVDSYEKVIIYKETGKRALIKITATENYPILAYTSDAKQWVKLYSPRDTKYKHSYLGNKPERYIHGLDRFNKRVKAIKNRIEEAAKLAEPDKKYIEMCERELENLKVFICSGGSDGLNLASIDENYYPIWFNSEAEQITYTELQLFYTHTKHVYNVPDIDKAGKKYAYNLAKQHWNLKTIWLPANKMVSEGKDLRNWFDYYKKSAAKDIAKHFEDLITGALKCKFFDTKRNTKGNLTHTINLSNLHYFLKVHDFYTYKIEQKHIDISGEDQIIFIRLEGNIVVKVLPRDIRRFCLAYVREKGQSLDIANKILSSPYFNENHLSGMEDIKIDFKNNTADSQFFFFNNQVAKITPEKIELKAHGKFENFAWSKQIIDHTITLEKPFFEYYKDELGNDRINVLRNDCEFQNYLINASRTYWQKELEESFENELLAEKYHNANRFNLNGENLTPEEHLIQEKHFLNKCYAIGYILHRYKQLSYAKCLYVMDDKPKESDDDANGRSGKSLLFQGVDKLNRNRFLIDGKNKSITQDRHIFHGLYDTNDYIQIDDADKYLEFKFFYTKITNSIIVNPKNSQPYEIPFEEAPKIAYITNYGMPNMTGSDYGRILFVSFSDYYHAKTEHYREERKPSHDFDGKDLFQGWETKQWNIFYNFMLQCCQLYLQHRGSEFQAPQDNITINNLRAGMGDNFEEWANSYFHADNLDRKIPRKELMDDYSDYVGGKSAKSSQAFKKALQSFCKIHNYKLNPVEAQGKDGRIKDNVFDVKKQKNTTVECFYIQSQEIVAAATIEEENTPKADLFNTKVQDDLPF